MLSAKKLQHKKEEEESISIYDIIKTTPVALDSTDDYIKEVGMHYLPFSIGIEWECPLINSDNKEVFNIPNLMDKSFSTDEQRFRIPNGIEGLNCLYNLSLALKQHAYLNPLSGIHYHVDCTMFWEHMTLDIVKNKEDYILKELDTWGYKGNFNKRAIKAGKFVWVGYRAYFKTLEFRIGEMTFEYELLFKRIEHLCKIVATVNKEIIKEKLKKENPILLYKQDEKDIKKIISKRKKTI